MTQNEDHRKTIHHTAGDRARVLPLLRDYLDRTGLLPADFARRINYAHSTLNLFMNDRYHNVAGTHALMCRAIEVYIHANPIEPPQEMLGELYETENARLIRRTIQELLLHPSGMLVYGPPGSQKSFTLEYEIARLNREEMPLNGQGRRAFYVYAMQGMKPVQLMKEIAIACGTSSAGDKTRILRNLAYDFRGRPVLVAIDESQNLGSTPNEWVDCLEMVRALLDRPPHFSLLLCGMHELITRFNRCSARLGQWNDRIVGKVMLPGLTEKEAREIAQREVPDISAGKMDKAIKLAKRTDAYNDDKQYINIRALTGTLRQLQMIKQAAI